MSRGPGDSPGAQALRNAGYVKIPGWWVSQEDMDLIRWIANKHLPEVNRIKAEAYGFTPGPAIMSGNNP